MCCEQRNTGRPLPPNRSGSAYALSIPTKARTSAEMSPLRQRTWARRTVVVNGIGGPEIIETRPIQCHDSADASPIEKPTSVTSSGLPL